VSILCTIIDRIFPSIAHAHKLLPYLGRRSLCVQSRNCQANLKNNQALTLRCCLPINCPHRKKDNLLAGFQSGFRHCHSTATAVVRIANNTLCSNDSSKVTTLVRLQLSAAFDTIDHEILLSHLQTDMGITGWDDTLIWVSLIWVSHLSRLRSYLTGRAHVVSRAGAYLIVSSCNLWLPTGIGSETSPFLHLHTAD